MKKTKVFICLLLVVALLVTIVSFAAGCSFTRFDWAYAAAEFLALGERRQNDDFVFQTFMGYALVLQGRNADSTAITVPQRIADDAGVAFTVVGINAEAFKENTTIQTVNLPASLQYIGESAFEGATALREVVFEGAERNNYFFLRPAAFKGTSDLREINLPNGLTDIPRQAFYRAFAVAPHGSDMTTLIIPDGVTYIGESAFEGARVQRINMPASIEEIGVRAFASVATGTGALDQPTAFLNFQMVRGQDGQFFQRPYTASDTRERETFEFPGGLRVIERQAFFHSAMITRWILPDSVEHIGGGAFAGANGASDLIRFRYAETGELVTATERFSFNFSMLMSYDGRELIAYTSHWLGNNAFEPGTGSGNAFRYVVRIREFAFGRINFQTQTHNPPQFTGFIAIPERITFIGDYAFAGLLGSDYVSEGHEPQPRPLLHLPRDLEFNHTVFSPRTMLVVAQGGSAWTNATQNATRTFTDWANQSITNNWTVRPS